jgi:DNA-binding PadR family transcriptional regulator
MKRMKDVYVLILRKIKLSGGILESALLEFIEDLPAKISCDIKSVSYYMILLRLKRGNFISIENSTTSRKDRIVKLTDEGQKYLESFHEIYSPQIKMNSAEKMQKEPVLIKDSQLTEMIIETLSNEARIDKERILKLFEILMKDIRSFLKRNNVFLISK